MPYPRPTPPRRFGFELLEDRSLLAATALQLSNDTPLGEPATGTAGPAADIVLDSVAFVDGRGQETTTIVIGQRVNLRVRYHFNDLDVTDHFIIRVALDGVTLDSGMIQGTAGMNVMRTFRNGGWLARPGSHTITVSIDATNAVAEINENNNATTFNFTSVAPNLAQKFTWPVAGVQSVDWTIENYLDADPRPNNHADYRGGPATYDGHEGVDFAIANYAAMDRGRSVFAAAAGTVIDTEDGHYDRWLTFVNPEPPSNLVVIDHGNGWQTAYFHLKRGSVLVQAGQQVMAGQQIGQVGGSGGTPLPQLHFEVTYRNTPVEPFLAPNDYFLSPRPYTFDAPRGLLDFGITNQPPTHEQIAEHVSNIDTFPVTSQRIQTYAWAIIASLHVGDTWKVRYLEPNGNVFSDAAPLVIQDAGAWQWYYWQTRLPVSPQTGPWRTEWYINGQLVGTHVFTVGAAMPEVRVLREHALNTGGELVSELLIDGRTTPIDFGSVSPGAPGPTQIFTVQNHGYANLVVSGIDLPAGYSIVEPLSTSIAPGASDTFTVRLDSNSAGRKAGPIIIHTNDTSELNSSFAVEGIVSGSLQGDYNSNGVVDAADYIVWRNTLGTAVTPRTGADGDGDGTIDQDDYAVWRANFGNRFGATAIAMLERSEQNLAVDASALPLVDGATLHAIDAAHVSASRFVPDVNSALRSAASHAAQGNGGRVPGLELLNLLPSPTLSVGQGSDTIFQNRRRPHEAARQPQDGYLAALDTAFHGIEVDINNWLRRQISVPPRGLQPTSESSTTTSGSANGGAKSGALPADLALVVERWPVLPRHAKATILGITRSAGQQNRNV